MNGLYQYVTALPPFLANAADSGTYYRVVVATTAANLANNCSYKDQNTTMIRAITCGVILQGNFIQFKGSIAGRKSTLNFSVTGEQNLKHYQVEKSSDGINFSIAGSIDAQNIARAHYIFVDPAEINGRVFYRLKMVQLDGLFKYSNIIELNSTMAFEVLHIQNPFADKIVADVNIPEAGPVSATLYNDKGQTVKIQSIPAARGLNKLQMPDAGSLPTGIYFISVSYKNQVYRTRLVKQ
ncbi:MAG: T9SS type A sorting domain-containing protein [Sphingobacteriales bacterium]|nr:MAG: T9SS type A sorting domain-containing protein [Sphingobacteriales bacterium]